jgi:hypothetical protein
VDARQRAHEAAVALVRHQADRACLADAEVRAGQADIRRLEDLPELAPRRLRKRLERGLDRSALDARKQLRNVLGRLVDCGRDDVCGVLACQLEDVLAEVGLDWLHTNLLERGVQANLLGRHRLRLGDHLRARTTADVDDVRARLVPRGGEAHVAASWLERGGELGHVLVEVVDRAHADLVRLFAQRLDVVELVPGR